MTDDEAIEICTKWFQYLDHQRDKAKKMSQLAAQAHKGPEEAKKAQAELRKMDRTPHVYDGGRLEPAVKHLVKQTLSTKT